MKSNPANRHPFLLWHEVLLVRMLIRSPRVHGLLVHSADSPLAWVLKKTISTAEPIEMLERAYANSPDADPA